MSMTTEQKEAIEKLQQKLNPKEFGGYCVLGYNQKYCFGKSEVEAIKTVLNLLQKQKKEIEKYKKLYQKALNDAVVTAHDNMHKDKIIDELAKAFKQDDVRSVEEIKRFYERKVKDEN